MAYYNTAETYGFVAKLLHWVIALLVIGMLCVGILMSKLPDTPFKGQVYMIHKLTGLCILILMIVRLIWVLINPKPRLPSTVPAWQGFLARSLHWGFYVLLIIMPISGLVMSTAAGRPPLLFGWEIAMPGIPLNKQIASQAAQTHGLLMWVIIAMIILHILAAFKHHFINKDNVLRRMLPWS